MSGFEQLLKPTEKVLNLEADRNNLNEGIVVDVVKKDDGIDCLFYVAPGNDPRRAESIIQKTCIDIFGHEPGPYIELFYHDPNASKIGFEVMNTRTMCHTMSVKIKPPKSLFYGDIGVLKMDIMQRIGVHSK